MLKWLKRFLLFFLTAVLLLLAVATINTYLKSSHQIVVKEKPAELQLGDSVFTRLSGAIQIKTVSYSRAEDRDTNAFRAFHSYLGKSFPLVHKQLKKENPGGYSLLYTWEGRNSKLPPVLLMAHQDVVPADDSAKWEEPPFSGVRKNGFIYGRGSLDIKSGIFAILESAELLLKEGFQPERTIYFAFGDDEESTGLGAKATADLLKSRGVRLDFVLDEGGIILKQALPGLDKPVALIGIAEKGAVNVKITAKGTGGHGSMPPPETAVTRLAEAITKIKDNPFPAAIGEPAKEMFEFAAPEMKFPFNVLFGNQWLTGSIILSQMSKTTSGNAAIRTTISVNMLKGSSKENVIPSEAVAIANLRIMPGTSRDYVKKYLEDVIEDKDVMVEIMEPFQLASAISSASSDGFKKIQIAVNKKFPEAVSAPFQLVAITDSRRYAEIAENIYRFHPAIYEKSDLERLHGRNERISEDNYLRTIGFYYEIMRSVE